MCLRCISAVHDMREFFSFKIKYEPTVAELIVQANIMFTRLSGYSLIRTMLFGSDMHKQCYGLQYISITFFAAFEKQRCCCHKIIQDVLWAGKSQDVTAVLP